MRRAYGGGKVRDKQRLQADCEKVIATYEALASQDDDLAEAEDDAAAQ